MKLHRVLSVFGLSVLAATSLAQQPTATGAQAAKAYNSQPIAFQPNRGQAAAPVQYLSHGRDYSVLLEPAAATLVLARAAGHGKPGHTESVASEAIRMTLAGANTAAAMVPDHVLPGYVSYLHGEDSAQWQTGIPTYAAARVVQAYPGIDLVYYGNQRNLEYDFVVAPQADPAQIRLRLGGAKPVLEPAGELRLQSSTRPAATDIVFHKPVLHQAGGVPVEGAFTLASNGEVGFRVGPYDHARELVIDPVIAYASYYGGPGEDEINGIAINSANQLYAVGQTYSTTLPAIAGEYQTTNTTTVAAHEAFVTKFSADGSTILWSTFIGGSQDDFATSVAVAAGTDQPIVVGYTNSCVAAGGVPAVFPHTADAYQPLCSPIGDGSLASGYSGTGEISSNSGYDAFLLKLSSNGKSLLYSTFLGGSANDFASAVVLDSAGRPYVTGETQATQYVYSNNLSRYSDVPSYPVNNHGTPGFGIANFPTTAGAFYSGITESKLYAGPDGSGNTSGPQDEQAFLAVFSADLKSLVYSSLIGGTGIGGCGNGACNTNSFAVAVNAAGQAFIGGINPAKSGAASLLFNTYMTGSSAGKDGNGTNLNPGSDVYGLIADSAGNVIATGDTNANNYPTTSGVYQPACALLPGNGKGQTNTCSSAFLTKLTPAGKTVWSTYYRGATPSIHSTAGRGLAVDSSDNVYVAGSGDAPSLPLLRAFATAPGGNPDYFLSEFSADASTLLAGTWIGLGGGMAPNNGLALDSGLNAYFSGSQGVNPYGGTYFPVSANAADKSIQGTDGFVLKVVTQPAVSTTALAISPTTATPGTSISFTATVSGNTAGVVPTGTVSLTSGATALGTITLANGAGVLKSTTLAAGTYQVVATYSGDGTYNPSATAAQTLTIRNLDAIALTVSPASALTGASVAFSATVSSSGGTPTGTVTFLDGTTTLGSAVLANGAASYTTASLAAGTHSISAQYGGDGNFNPIHSTPQTVAVTAPTASLVLAVTPATVVVGNAVTVSNTLTATNGGPAPTGAVVFYDGSTVLVNGLGNFGYQVTNLSVGTHVLTAKYTGDSVYAASASNAVTVTVTNL